MDENIPQKTPLRRPVQQIPQEPEKKKERIKTWMAACMIIVALCVDGAQAVLTFLGIGLVLGPIMSVAAYFIFWIWFMLLGVSFTKSPKKLGAMGGAAVIEFFFSFLPGFTAGITATVFMTMAEDKGGMLGKLASAAQGNISGAMQPPTPQFAGFARQEGSMRRLQPNTLNIQNKQPATNTAGRPPSQNIKNWEESTKKLNDIQHRQFVDKNYDGGMDKYKQDEAKQVADRERRDDAQRKFKESAKRYDGMFNGENPSGPMQIAKE